MSNIGSDLPVFQGTWADQPYRRGDLVLRSGVLYQAVTDTSAQPGATAATPGKGNPASWVDVTALVLDFTGSVDPTAGAGIPTAIGSTYHYAGTGLYVKTASGATAWTDAAGGGGGLAVLEDPGTDWTPATVVTVGYRIGHLHAGDTHVFEATVDGTTADWATSFDELGPRYSPGSLTNGDDLSGGGWRHIGIVGTVAEASLPGLRPFVGIVASSDGGFTAVDGPKTAANHRRMFQLRVALADPGNEWQAETAVSGQDDRISVIVDGALRVFEPQTGTTDVTEPAWEVTAIGDTTSDGTASWSYIGIVGDPDSQHPLFDVKTDGDADWFLDADQGASFRFSGARNGVATGGGYIQLSTDGFQVADNAGGGNAFIVTYGPPWTVRVVGLPSSDPGVATQLYTDGVPSAGAPKALMISGGPA